MWPRLTTIALCVLGAPALLIADNWPQWRGPLGTGISPEANLPTAWSPTSNVAWRAALPGSGVSSPVVWGDLVFVTAQVGTGERRPGNHPTLVQGADAAGAGERTLAARAADDNSVTFLTSAYRWADGSLAWSHRLPAEGPLPGVHDKHNLASPSPATDGSVVVGWFGTGQIVALDPAGKTLWSKHLGKESPFEITWGHASSPVIHGDLVVLLCYHESASYLLALDKRTGAQRWRVDRGKGIVSYSTPIVIDTPQGPAMLVNSSTGIEAFRVDTGESLWRVLEDSRFPIPVPALIDGVIYATRGYRSGPYLAIRPGGSGDVTQSHVLWKIPTGAPYVSSLVHYRGLIYTASEQGVVTCLDAATGARVWQERIGGIFSASPIAGDGKIYFVGETGETVVLQAGRTANVLARNRLEGRFSASPAVSRGRIFLRGDDVLFAVGK